MQEIKQLIGQAKASRKEKFEFLDQNRRNNKENIFKIMFINKTKKIFLEAFEM